MRNGLTLYKRRNMLRLYDGDVEWWECGRKRDAEKK
jgi:hypothetical protein